MDLSISLNFLRILLEVYAFVAVMRALMQYTDADFHNPFSQFIDRATSGPIRALRKLVPRISGKDLLSPLVLALVVIAIERLMFINAQGFSDNGLALLILTPAKFLDHAITIFIFAVLIRVVISWVIPRITPFTRLILTFTEPIMRPARRIIPTFAGLDFSPILVLILLELANSIGVAFLESLGYQMLG